MACPTCDHTMQQIGVRQGDPVFWCPRCGSVRIAWAPHGRDDDNEDSVPKLVPRCRQFELDGSLRAEEWHRLGIAESINVPANRLSPESTHA